MGAAPTLLGWSSQAGAISVLYRLYQALVRFRRVVEQGEDLPGVFLRKPDDRLALDHALCLLS